MWIGLVWTLSSLPSALEGQVIPTEAGAETESAHEPGPWWTLWSRPQGVDRVIGSMWSWHLRRLEWGLEYNHAFGLSYRNVFAATFRTTHDERGWAVGTDRVWARTRRGVFEASVGFRAGLVYGYDERLDVIGDLSPILPFAMPVVFVSGGPIWVELSQVWRVASLMVGVRF